MEQIFDDVYYELHIVKEMPYMASSNDYIKERFEKHIIRNVEASSIGMLGMTTKTASQRTLHSWWFWSDRAEHHHESSLSSTAIEGPQRCQTSSIGTLGVSQLRTVIRLPATSTAWRQRICCCWFGRWSALELRQSLLSLPMQSLLSLLRRSRSRSSFSALPSVRKYNCVRCNNAEWKHTNFCHDTPDPLLLRVQISYLISRRILISLWHVYNFMPGFRHTLDQ